jgi:hypothetical protein
MSEAANDPSGAQQGATGRNKKKMSPADVARILLRNQQLTERQLSAVELLMRGLSDAQVAAQLGVDRGTVYRWRTSSLFLKELERQRKLLYEQSAARLQAMIQPALEILNRQLTGDDPKTALRAAAILLRVASPARLARFADPDNSTPRRSPADDRWEKIKAYIDAPLPGEPGAPTHAPWEENDEDDLDDDEHDEENDE